MYLVVFRQKERSNRMDDSYRMIVEDAVAANNTMNNPDLECKVYKMDALTEIKKFDIKVKETVA